jgi:chromosome segregation ATPase
MGTHPCKEVEMTEPTPYVKLQKNCRELCNEYNRKERELEQAKVAYIEAQAKIMRLKPELRHMKDRIERMTEEMKRMEEILR